MLFIKWLVAALHLLALGVGLGSIWWRARSLRGTLDRDGLRRVFHADNLWGLAALLWISTGLARAFAGLEKGSNYYLSSNAFWLKMGLLAIILVLEARPASTLIRWRVLLAQNKAHEIDPHLANQLASTSMIQAGLVVGMVFAGTAMARGIGF